MIGNQLKYKLVGDLERKEGSGSIVINSIPIQSTNKNCSSGVYYFKKLRWSLNGQKINNYDDLEFKDVWIYLFKRLDASDFGDFYNPWSSSTLWNRHLIFCERIL
jgi:hypothetical protein